MTPATDRPAAAESPGGRSLIDRARGLVRSLFPAASDDRRPSNTGASAESTATEPTDEERVQRILASAGGRLKQTTIKDVTDWSEAKVSRVLCDMEDAGEIRRYRVGREKVVCLPDEPT